MKLSKEQIVQKVREALTDDLRRAPWKGNTNCYAGHCYVASEALYHMLGGAAGGWKPMHVKHEGAPHWYLQNDSGEVIDPTAEQFKTAVPYSKGKGKGFLTKQPSKRAQIVMDRVQGKSEAIQKAREEFWQRIAKEEADELERLWAAGDEKGLKLALSNPDITEAQIRNLFAKIGNENPGASLNEFLDSGEKVEPYAKKVLKRKDLSPDMLSYLMKYRYVPHDDILNHPNANAAVLHQAMEGDYMDRSWMFKPYFDETHIQRMLDNRHNHNTDHLLLALGHDKVTEAQLAETVNRMTGEGASDQTPLDINLAHAALENSRLPFDSVRRALEVPRFVRSTVESRKDIPSQVLHETMQKMLEHGDVGHKTFASILEHPNAAPETFELAAANQKSLDGSNILYSSPKLPPHLIDKFVFHGDDDDREKIAQNPSLTDKHIDFLLRCDNESARYQVLRNPNIKPYHAAMALGDSDSAVRRRAIFSGKAPDEAVNNYLRTASLPQLGDIVSMAPKGFLKPEHHEAILDRSDLRPMDVRDHLTEAPDLAPEKLQSLYDRYLASHVDFTDGLAARVHDPAGLAQWVQEQTKNPVKGYSDQELQQLSPILTHKNTPRPLVDKIFARPGLDVLKGNLARRADLTPQEILHLQTAHESLHPGEKRHYSWVAEEAAKSPSATEESLLEALAQGPRTGAFAANNRRATQGVLQAALNNDTYDPANRYSEGIAQYALENPNIEAQTILRALPGIPPDNFVATKANQVLQDLSPDTVYDNRINVKLGTAKLRKVRDIIMASGKPDLSPKQLPPGDWSMGRVANGNVSAAKLQDHIDKLPGLLYNVSEGRWDGIQRHSDEPSRVCQINLTNDHIRKMKDMGVWSTFKDLQKELSEHHPITPHTIGWVRFTGDEQRGIHIDEIQSDYELPIQKKFPNMSDDQKRNLEKRFPEEHQRVMRGIIFGNSKPAEVLHEAFHEALRKSNAIGTPVAIHAFKTKVTNPNLVTFNENLDEDHLDKAPAHFRETYDNLPKRAGYEPSTYGKVHSQTNPDLEGKDTYQTVVRKSEEALQKMAIPDLPRGKFVTTGPAGAKVFDYTHLLAPEDRSAGYTMKITHNRNYNHTSVDVDLLHKGKSVGFINGQVEKDPYGEKFVNPWHAEVNENHQGKGLGKAMYEALYAHAFHTFEAPESRGGLHSTFASYVHRSLARAHKLAYNPRPNPKAAGRPEGDYDDKFLPYRYSLLPSDEKTSQLYPEPRHARRTG
jgi:ribosomal protein S18 acetylase RimI-like enzyme